MELYRGYKDGAYNIKNPLEVLQECKEDVAIHTTALVPEREHFKTRSSLVMDLGDSSYLWPHYRNSRYNLSKLTTGNHFRTET